MGHQFVLLISASIFCIGTVGFLIRKNPLIMFMSVELMLNGVNIALIAFARMHAEGAGAEYGQIFFLMVMAVAAAEVAVVDDTTDDTTDDVVPD